MKADAVRRILGSDAVVGTNPEGSPVVAPAEEAAVALLLRTASAKGWCVRVAGLGHWSTDAGPADLVLSTRRLDRRISAVPADLVVTADAGVPWPVLQASLAESGVWIGLDHPGEERTVGSVVATGTVGALSAGMGRVRDHVLGLTFVTGDGRIVRVGGTVVKNVAGYDLTKLAVGSFGAFGVLTSVTFRLRAVPRADRTLRASGPRDTLLEAAMAVSEVGVIPSALELFTPDAADPDTWSLAVRLTGRDADVQATTDAVHRHAPVTWESVSPDSAAAFWNDRQVAATLHPTTLRLGSVPTGLAKCCDALARTGRSVAINVSVPAGLVRATADVTADAVHRLRHAMAELEVPVTVERGPWTMLAATGHYGAYREGVGRLVSRLRETFDPAGVLAVPLGTDS